MEAYLSRPRGAADGRPVAASPAWPASSSAGSTPRSTAASTPSARPRRSALRGKAAVAQGKLAYQLFRSAFSGPRWEALAARGARLQRPLWASTSTKNPAYPDTLYVDELIGPDTVNTLPDATIEAFADHGTLARTVDADVDEAEAVVARRSPTSASTWTTSPRSSSAKAWRRFQKSFDELLGALDDEGHRAAGTDLAGGAAPARDDLRATGAGLPPAPPQPLGAMDAPSARPIHRDHAGRGAAHLPAGCRHRAGPGSR